MEDRETARMRKYGENKMTRIMMATVPHVISGLGLRKFQVDGFLLTRVYKCFIFLICAIFLVTNVLYICQLHAICTVLNVKLLENRVLRTMLRKKRDIVRNSI